MEIKKLKKIKRAIENFFYNVKFNIALYKISNTEEYLDLRSNLKSGIEKQFLYYSKVEKVKEIAGDKTEKISDRELIRNLLLLWIPLSEFVNKDSVVDAMLATAQKSGQYAIDKLNVDGTFNLENEVIMSAIKSGVDKMFDQVDTTTQNWIASTVNDGLKKNIKYQEIARAIRNSAKKMAVQRAEVIAEYETAKVLGKIELEVYKRNGVQFFKWITSRDEKVCDRCDANEGVGEVPVGDDFPTGVDAPPDHIRCRCFLMPVIPLDFNLKWTGE